MSAEFLELMPPPEALAFFMDKLDLSGGQESIATTDALGRVLAEEIRAPFALPSFARSTVDGYAVRAADTHGASESLPAYLELAGEALMGTTPDFSLKPGQCGLIHTGGMIPAGADAVVMIELTQSPMESEVEILKAVAAGENVLQIGEDVRANQVVIRRGTRIRPAEIGGLMALGITEVTVSKQPRVAVLSSGDEIIPPGQAIGPGQIYDINSYTLSSLIEEAGGQPTQYGIIPDRADAFAASAARALAENDIVLFTAGSSVSVRDLTATTIGALGQPGVLVHGVNVRPGKPTILALCDNKPVIGLPGNPVSALVIAEIFLVPVITAWLGASSRPTGQINATLATNLNSQSGREDWVPVRLISSKSGYVAEPVFGKSNLIFTLARADGLLRIHPDANGIAAGEVVEIRLL